MHDFFLDKASTKWEADGAYSPTKSHAFDVAEM